MQPIQALLFDLDGTLTHTDPVHLRAMQRLMLDEGLWIDEPGFREHVSGRSNAEIGLRLFPERTAEALAVLLARKEALFRELAVSLEPLAGVIELIDSAKQRGMRLALVTNAPRDNVSHMLNALGLSDRFDALVYGEELERPKPDALPYLTGLKRLDVGAQSAVAFEDSLPGVTAARAAGIFTVGIATTRSAEELIGAGADLAAADFTDDDLLNLFERNSGDVRL